MTDNITEDYVSYETAKLLKEKGFDEFCRAHYDITNGDLYYEKVEVEASGCEMHNSVLAPTLQMAMKWLREEHSIHIKIDCIGAKNYIPTIQFTYFGKDIVVESNTSKIGGNGFDSNEEACEAAIKYCLENLI